MFLTFVSWDAPVSPGDWLQHPNGPNWCLTGSSVHTHRSKETGGLVLKMSQPKKKRWKSNADPCRVWVREAAGSPRTFSTHSLRPQVSGVGSRSFLPAEFKRWFLVIAHGQSALSSHTSIGDDQDNSGTTVQPLLPGLIRIFKNF